MNKSDAEIIAEELERNALLRAAHWADMAANVTPESVTGPDALRRYATAVRQGIVDIYGPRGRSAN